jgi:glycosyltransferase involved in cell wall biosynthesis
MKISIVTPSLNQGPWIGETLRSVREAALVAEIETDHQVIDGGSTDATPTILAGQNFARWISEPDAGQTDAINKGLLRATGDILTYLCADDLLEPSALALVAAAFRENPAADVVYGDGCFLESGSGWKRRKSAGDFSWRRLRRHNFLLQPAVFWRRSVYEHFGELDPKLQYCMDHEYWLRIGAYTHWHYLREPLAVSRLHASAKTSRALAPAWREAAVMQERYGIHFKPKCDALWMSLAGRHLYRFKRVVLAWVGQRFIHS